MYVQIKKYDSKKIASEETLFHNANGYLGVRSNFEEFDATTAGSIRGTYINGFYDIKDLKYSEKLYGFSETEQTLVNLIDAQGICTYVQGEKLKIIEKNIKVYEHTLDMEKGITKRYVEFADTQGRIFCLEVIRMTSFKESSLFTIEYKLLSKDYEGPIQIESSIITNVANYYNPNDPRVAQESNEFLKEKKLNYKDEKTFALCKTSRSDLQVACVSKLEIIPENIKNEKASLSFEKTGHKVLTKINKVIQKGEEIHFIKYITYIDSRIEKDPLYKADEILVEVMKKKISYYYKEQKNYLNKCWEAIGLELRGVPTIRKGLTFSLYELIQGMGINGEYGIAAKGLSGEGYEGHYFWDMEIYIFPVFLAIFPEKSKNLLHLRYKMLIEAKKHAKEMGHIKGALFAWRTITGGECSSYFPSGSAQYHINGDIAYAFVQYFLATEDLKYMEKEGAEVLIETARLWLDVGHFTKNAFCIDCVTGPDEYTCIVNNNYYTNAVAKENLFWAAEICNRLRQDQKINKVIEQTGITLEEEALFLRASEKMYLPYNKEKQISEQDDSFLQKKEWDIPSIPKENFPLLLHYHPLYIYRHQICKQADTVLAHVLFNVEKRQEVIKKTFAYYEKRTTHDSSLSICGYGIQAARIGQGEKAFAYFNENVTMDLFDTHHNTDMGIHTANMGGSYLMLFKGLGGVQIKTEGLEIAPVFVKEIKKYAFNFMYRGRKIRLSVEGKKFSIENKGTPLRIKVYKQNEIIMKEKEFDIQQVSSIDKGGDIINVKSSII